MSQGVECYSCLPKTAWPPTCNNVSVITNSNLTDLRTDYPAITDANALSVNLDTGFYICDGTTSNIPAGATNGGTLIHMPRKNRANQIFFDYANVIMYLRSYSTGSVWTAWEAVGTSKNKDTWHDASLQNSWANCGGAFANAGYTITADNHVELRGNIKTGATGTVAFTLPAGYRPLTEQLIPLLSNGATSPASIDIIASTGVCYVNWAGANTNISLANVRFPLF